MDNVTALHGEDIILISNQMLEDRYWTSKQYITQELKKNNRVLYVEANYSFGKLFLGIVKGNWPVKPFGALRQESDNLWVLTPFPRLAFRNHLKFMSWKNQFLLRFKIKRAVKHLNFKTPILWTFLHQTANVVSKMNEKFAVYHCVDDWPALLPMAGMGKPAQVIVDENKLMNKVDLIIRVSEKLLAGREPQHTPVEDIPNGVDTNLFKPIEVTDRKVFEDLVDLPKPLIGFSGSIGPWIDTELIRKVAVRFPQASVVLIGLNEKNPSLQALLELENIHFLGMKKRTDVPHYLAQFDVCLMPFDKGQVGEGLLPLKMFEYLAVGRPVVAISSKTMKRFEDVLYHAHDDESFIKKVEEALAQGLQPGLVDARVQKANEYSWEKRVLKYSTNIKKIMAHTK